MTHCHTIPLLPRSGLDFLPFASSGFRKKSQGDTKRDQIHADSSLQPCSRACFNAWEVQKAFSKIRYPFPQKNSFLFLVISCHHDDFGNIHPAAAQSCGVAIALLHHTCRPVPTAETGEKTALKSNPSAHYISSFLSSFLRGLV